MISLYHHFTKIKNDRKNWKYYVGLLGKFLIKRAEYKLSKKKLLGTIKTQ